MATDTLTTTSSRRGLLRGLVSLPLIGGGVTLIGNPTAAAEPVTSDLLENYATWLHYEKRYLNFERERLGHDVGYINIDNPAGEYHGSPWRPKGQPSTRAAIVLSAVGCDWRV